MYTKLFRSVILLLACSWKFCNSLEENPKFCIHTEPMLLTDLENHVNPLEGDPMCEILATTLTGKEKESFFHTMCKDHGALYKEEYHYFKLRNGELRGRTSYLNICDGKNPNPMLAWIPYKMMQSYYAAELNPKERVSYIAKATDVEREKTELCHFRHIDMVTNIAESLFSCVVMIFEDNFYGLDDSINVLVEIEPIMYQLSNVTYLPWFNVSSSYKTSVGKSFLKNTKKDARQLYGSINYSYVEKVELNLTSVYGNKLEKLPLLFEHKGAVLALDNRGVGGMEVKDKAFFGRKMDGKSNVSVEIIGQWAQHNRQFNANLYQYYGYGIKRFLQELHSGFLSLVLIDSTEAVYDAPESTHLTTITTITSKSARLTADEQNSTESAQAYDWEGEDFGPAEGHRYRQFYGWAVVAALSVGVLLLIGVYALVRYCSKQENRENYKFTGIQS